MDASLKAKTRIVFYYFKFIHHLWNAPFFNAGLQWMICVWSVIALISDLSLSKLALLPYKWWGALRSLCGDLPAVPTLVLVCLSDYIWLRFPVGSMLCAPSSRYSLVSGRRSQLIAFSTVDASFQVPPPLTVGIDPISFFMTHSFISFESRFSVLIFPSSPSNFLNDVRKFGGSCLFSSCLNMRGTPANV